MENGILGVETDLGTGVAEDPGARANALRCLPAGQFAVMVEIGLAGIETNDAWRPEDAKRVDEDMHGSDHDQGRDDGGQHPAQIGAPGVGKQRGSHQN